MADAFINIGFGNVIARDRAVCVIAPGSSPVKKLKDVARAQGKLIDASQGRRTRAVIVTDSDHVVLSAINPDLIYLNAPGYGVDGPCGRKPAFAPTIGACSSPIPVPAGPSIARRPDLSLDEIKPMSLRLGMAAQAPGNADG